MIINRIKLFNIGSYEGEVVFNTKINDKKNIILIGGKNGTGKTTLFTAMRLCLYGYMSLGYKNINAHYIKAVNKIINNTARLHRPACASVEMEIALSNGHEYDTYNLRREWTVDEKTDENFTIIKNDNELDEKSIVDFEKYLLSLIPPELFNLYFFDGEKIADFFMTEGSNSRIKDAFLTLCGYDTFEIMKRNFKRLGTTNGDSSRLLGEYVAANDTYETLSRAYENTKNKLDGLRSEMEMCDAEITAIDTEYSKKGGISEDEHRSKLVKLKEEERNREQWNALLKKWANDIVPLAMIRQSLNSVKEQINEENNNLRYKDFIEVLDEILPDNSDIAGELKCLVEKKYSADKANILDLSFEQKTEVLSQINRILDFDVSKIKKYKNLIKNSVTISAKIREDLNNSNIESARDYAMQKTALVEKKSALLDEVLAIEHLLAETEESLASAKSVLIKTQQELESELKKQSINDISAKAILMLDNLQKVLYRNQIAKAEKTFRKEIATLMRKTDFIDDIFIDDAFNIHIYRNEEHTVEQLSDTIAMNTEQQLCILWGAKAVEYIKKICGTDVYNGCENWIRFTGLTSVKVPVEIDKASLSAGEKQIFIMALYHSLVSLSNHEIPFIIDTPFARIDTEHRQNISKYFFNKLHGQVFILSTNEEIDNEHVRIMNKKIVATYVLENEDNKRTTVICDRYFKED